MANAERNSKKGGLNNFVIPPDLDAIARAVVEIMTTTVEANLKCYRIGEKNA